MKTIQQLKLVILKQKLRQDNLETTEQYHKSVATHILMFVVATTHVCKLLVQWFSSH